MFFVGIFSNIIPVIVLCVVSLGFYINGNEIDSTLVNSDGYDLTESYQLQINDLTNSYDFEIESAIDSENQNRTIVPIKYKSGFYKGPILNLITQQIPINSYRGSPLYS